MLGRFGIGPGLAAAALAVIGIPAPGAAAPLELERTPLLVSIPVSYAFGTSAVDGQDLGAWGVGVGFQQVAPGGRWSVGASFSYIAGETKTTTLTDGEANVHYRTVPATIDFRGYLVPSGRGWNAYAGLGMGVGFNRTERTTDSTRVTVYDSNVSLRVPLGFLIALTPDVALEVGYSFLWVNDSFLDGDYANQILLGITLPK